MRFYVRNLWIVSAITFGSILFWLFSSQNSFATSHRHHLAPRPEGLTNDNTIPSAPNIIFSKPTLSKWNNGPEKPPKVSRSKRLKNILCKINEEYDVNCLKYQHNHETIVFVPFPFIKKYFEVFGKLVKGEDQKEYFEWSHSYSKIFIPDSVYDSKGVFLWFENYNVETRERVLCVSANEGVPISTQWYSAGHFYPTQIAQFGLSHYNKNLTKPLAKQITLINSNITSKHLTIKSGTLISNPTADHIQSTNGTILSIDKALEDYPYIDVHAKLSRQSSITFVVENIYSRDEYKLIFSPTNEAIRSENNRSVVYGLGVKREDHWHVFTRDVLVDLFKAKLITERKPGDFKLGRIELSGAVAIKRLSLLSDASHLFALAAGDWFVRHQNQRGGWEITVKRKLSKGALVLDEGWHSAMAQGQAVSLLTRLYRTTAKVKYLEAAKKAINIFNFTSSENGVRSTIFDKYVWYEEYPTVPSIYVLNGFIYSLFGLYDLSEACADATCQHARNLFDEGLRSLEALLPLFDSGSGSFYDLRHLSMNIAPNLARWDYHSTHVNQLLYLNTIVHNDIFKATADRWAAYMRGHRAEHN